jgi:hypothetical protein
MKKINIILGAILFASVMMISCNNSSKEIKQESKYEDTTTISPDTLSIKANVDNTMKDTLRAKVNIVNVKKKDDMLPDEYFGEWYFDKESLSLCGNGLGLVISRDKKETYISYSTEWGLGDLKVEKKEDYYIVKGKMSSEGENWESEIILKMVQNNLFVNFEDKNLNNLGKMYRCPDKK